MSSVTFLQPVILTNCGFSVGGVAGVAVGLTLVVAVPVSSGCCAGLFGDVVSNEEKRRQEEGSTTIQQ